LAIRLKYAVVDELAKVHNLVIDVADLVLSKTPEGDPDEITDDVVLKDLGARLFGWRRSMIELHFEEFSKGAFARWFPREATIDEVRREVAGHFDVMIDAVFLFFAGRELPDEMTVEGLRIEPTDVIVVTIQDVDMTLLETCDPVRDTCVCTLLPADGEPFEIELFPSDTIDRVRITVAERRGTQPDLITIWSNKRLLADDVVLSSLGPAPELEVKEVSPDVIVNSRRRFASVRKSISLRPDSVVFGDEADSDAGSGMQMPASMSSADRAKVQALCHTFGGQAAFSALELAGGDPCAASIILKATRS
jgi:hypothetical protein